MGLFDKLLNNGLDGVMSAIENAGEKAVQAEAAEAPEAQNMLLRFGSQSPFPYADEIQGNPVKLGIRLYGQANISVSDSEAVKSCGGLKALEEPLRAEIVAAGHEALRRYSAKRAPYTRLPAYAKDIECAISAKADSEWESRYGVRLDKVTIMSVTLTEEARQTVEAARRQSMGWVCPACGANNTSKFCTNCGAKRGDPDADIRG